jgi:CheY-like chemotaxis protein
MRDHSHHDVLVVDPEAEVGACLKLYLQMHGFRAIATRTWSDTLEVVRLGFRPCIVFVDPRSREADAWEIVDYLRADSIVGKIPMVFVSDCPRQLRRAARFGIEALIAKPAPPHRWIDAVERQCRYRWWLRAPVDAAPLVITSGLGRASARQVSAGSRVVPGARRRRPTAEFGA